jgi:hypothetical protein
MAQLSCTLWSLFIQSSTQSALCLIVLVEVRLRARVTSNSDPNSELKCESSEGVFEDDIRRVDWGVNL